MGTFNDKYGFALDKVYPTVTPSGPDDYLNAVKRSERSIVTAQRNAYDGVYWLGTDTSAIDYTLYRGVTGLAYFYLKLAQIDGGDRYIDTAKRALEYIAKHWRIVAETPNDEWLKHREKGLYGGIAGLGTVLLEGWRVFGLPQYREAVEGIAQWYVDNVSRDEQGVYWSGNTAVLLDSGAVLFLIEAYDKLNLDDQALRNIILSAGNRILATGKASEDGGLWFDVFEGTVETFIEPGFELGTAGVAFLLVKLYEFSGDDNYLEAARRADLYLQTLLVPQSRGALLPYRFDHEGHPLTENGNVVYYLGACHGPAGTAKFYYELAKVTGESKYRDTIVRLVDGLEAQGAPERQSTGLWNSVNYCCGHAGLIHLFVGLYADDHDERWLNLARRAARVVLGQEEILPNGSSDWPLAFTRVEPNVYSRPKGFYTGTAGIAASLLELYALETGREGWLRLADDPFPETFHA